MATDDEGTIEIRPQAQGPRHQLAKFALAMALFAVVVGVVVTNRAEWARTLDPRAAAAQRPGPRPSAGDFDLSRVTIFRDEIRGGGPPKDGIPALTDPKVVGAAAATYRSGDDRVAGVTLGGEARAYPLGILTWHEIVNDTLGGVPIAVTYCPLCDSVAVFDRRGPDGVREFGVSGLLYNSNVLMYDRGGRPEALWSQLKGESISGPAAGTRLEALPVELTTWASWRSRFPRTTVLSSETSYGRDYRHDPYAGYFAQPGLMFPVRPTDNRRPAKERVLGVWIPGGAAKAYPVSAFSDAGQPVVIRDDVGGKPVELHYDPASKSLGVVNAPEEARWMYSFWFAWYAFHPETTVYKRR